MAKVLKFIYELTFLLFANYISFKFNLYIYAYYINITIKKHFSKNLGRISLLYCLKYLDWNASNYFIFFDELCVLIQTAMSVFNNF
jgi:hypothetical protein